MAKKVYETWKCPKCIITTSILKDACKSVVCARCQVPCEVSK